MSWCFTNQKRWGGRWREYFTVNICLYEVLRYVGLLIQGDWVFLSPLRLPSFYFLFLCAQARRPRTNIFLCYLGYPPIHFFNSQTLFLPLQHLSLLCASSVDWNDSCRGESSYPVVPWLERYFTAQRQSSYNTQSGVNTVIARPCDISFCLLEQPFILQFHGVYGTLNKLLFKNKGMSGLRRWLCPAGITLWRSVWCSIGWSVAFAVSK